jgi:hypothetical protein
LPFRLGKVLHGAAPIFFLWLQSDIPSTLLGLVLFALPDRCVREIGAAS